MKHHPSLVMLDRDGVINFDSPDFILTPAQWRAIPGSLEAIARLHAAGIAVTIISNQSALARGYLDQETFHAIQAKMLLAIEQSGGFISHVCFCPHGPDDDCNCRKPKPGMVHETLDALGLTADQAVMIGDSVRDVGAAHAAGVKAILVQSGYGDADVILQKARTIQPDVEAYADLQVAVDTLLGEERPC